MTNLMELRDRTILVTGASSGLGRAISVLLSELGARVVLVARDEKRAEHTLALMEGAGHVVSLFDLADCDGIGPWMRELVGRTGPLSGLVHAAGVQKTRPLRVTSAGAIDEVMRINLYAAVALTKGFCQKGAATGHGSVVYISGGVAFVGQAGVAAYAASKGALVSLAKSLAVELARDGIRVNCVCPGYVATEMLHRLRETLTAEQYEAIEKRHPLGIGRPRDVANAVAFLLGDAARWITGTALIVDGGYTCTAGAGM
jgi:NAD(P)-dependent dehydrogenase (short-subunit alcohol dehydrogenase family)